MTIAKVQSATSYGKYDMASVAEGTHLWNVKACNVWGCSEPSPFGFTKSLPGQLQGVKIIGE